MKKSLTLLIGLILIFSLAGCGEKSQEDVLNALQTKMDEISGYKTEATMTLQTGNEPQTYDIEVWHQKDDYYRVQLENSDKEQSQIILRNDEGVFVLTPSLNKSFRFQSDWPDNSSQAYLYESLVNDILSDEESTFEATEDHYVFTTKTNYQNSKTLPKQEIHLSKEDLTPVEVMVMDQDDNPLVQVDFASFEFDPEFDEGAFDMKRNMSSAQIDIPTMGDNELEDKEMMVLYPKQENLPEGVELVEEKEVASNDGERVVLTYSGQEKSFTLYQEKAKALAASNPIEVDGEPVNLGFAVGVLTNTSLQWTNDGVQYHLASDTLSKEELIEVATSVQGKATK
jgi:outer membrane lipoprotein-sorting protein